jgi:RNA polymerase sigma-70 factor (ECF subfamily)
MDKVLWPRIQKKVVSGATQLARAIHYAHEHGWVTPVFDEAKAAPSHVAWQRGPTWRQRQRPESGFLLWVSDTIMAAPRLWAAWVLSGDPGELSADCRERFSMRADKWDERLSRISTMWTKLRQAHEGSHDAALSARQELMQRYCGAVYRYLLSAVRDPHTAEDLTQEFALRFVSGRFRGADPEHGRFRDYVKRGLFNLVADYRRRQQKDPRPVSMENNEPAAVGDDPLEAEQTFLASWRQELLSRAWQVLAKAQEESGHAYHSVLRFRVENPELRSTQMAERLSQTLGKPVTAAGVRQLLHRARERFAQALIEETRHSLGAATQDQLEEELAELNLLKYCQSALKDGGE